ncbi:MAG: nitrite reductase [Deltaproteobacteria bacterium]|nr:nitrite reductase [Deltaproteobacteria bacterium]
MRKAFQLVSLFAVVIIAAGLTVSCKGKDGGGAAPAGAPAAAPAADSGPAMSDADFEKAKGIYFDRCGGCHGTLRKGATGPDITPANTTKKTLEKLEKTIFDGTPAGMPGWGRQGLMTKEETTLMAKYIQKPAPIPPEMGLAKIKTTHKLMVPVAQRPSSPEHGRDINEFFGFILRDVGKGAIIDGKTKELMSVVDTGFAVHIFRSSSSGRYFYTVGRDGKVNAIDLFAKTPNVVAEVKTCTEARSIDVSKYNGPKGNFVDKYAVVGCYWPPQMVVLDGQTLEPLKIISTRSHTYDENEYHPEPRVAAIIASHYDSEWVVAVKETGMVWLVDYADLNNLKMTQIAAERFLHDGGWDATKRYFLVAANMKDQMVVVDTKEKKFVTKFETGTKPHPGRGANWVDPKYGPVNATVHLGEGKIAVYGADPKGNPQHAWKVLYEAETEGPGLFIKTHPKSNHVWADNTIAKTEGANKKVCVLKKDKMEEGTNCFQVTDVGLVVHFEYNKAGDEVWISVWDKKGKILVYDDKTLKLKHTIENQDWLVTPTGKWNVYNTVHDIY